MDPAEVVELEAMAMQNAMNEAAARGDSEIQRFYSGTVIFLTGGTGYLGKLLIEKLIRFCNVKKIYVLLRPKKGNTIQERLEELTNDPIFNTIRINKPHFENILVPIEGNVRELRLGINTEDWTLLKEEVQVIFHSAAITKFNELLSNATLINVRGAREALFLGKECKNLKSYVHLSTGYAQATGNRIGSEVLEEFYPSPIHPDILIRMAECMDSNRMAAISDKLIEGWPNSYTFTKAVTEELVRTTAGDLPICIVRPTIAMSCFYEPFPGWLDPSCVNGAIGIPYGVTLGISHVILHKEYEIALVPADYVNNAILAAGFKTFEIYKRGIKDINIYTTSSGRARITMGRTARVLQRKFCRPYPSPKSLGYCFVLSTGNKHLFWVLTWLLHYIPAYLMDAGCYIFGISKPRGIKSFVMVYSKIYMASLFLSYFTTNEWDLVNDNTMELYQGLSSTDKAMFNFDFSSLDYDRFSFIMGLGVRKYIIKDGLKNTSQGIKRQFWFKIATFAFAVVYIFIFFTLLYSVYLGVKHITTWI